uniref:Uncharacterized protein n=1 Tax=Rhizophora mucronata TaxID=61149 RepID=A0A2P2NFW7_RHIMU
MMNLVIMSEKKKKGVPSIIYCIQSPRQDMWFALPTCASGRFITRYAA